MTEAIHPAIHAEHVKIWGSIHNLDAEVRVLKETISQTATKEDIASVRGDISTAVNGLLKDALASVPARQMALWTIVMAVAAIVAPWIVEVLR